MSFWKGFEKQAEERKKTVKEKLFGGPEDHHLRREFLGNSISSAVEAKKGKKMEAFKNAYKHDLKSRLKGFGQGATLGTAAGGLLGLMSGGSKGIASGAVLGGMGGAAIGTRVGQYKGTHGPEASRIHGENSQHKTAAQVKLPGGKSKDASKLTAAEHDHVSRKMVGGMSELGAGAGAAYGAYKSVSPAMQSRIKRVASGALGGHIVGGVAGGLAGAGIARMALGKRKKEDKK